MTAATAEAPALVQLRPPPHPPHPFGPYRLAADGATWERFDTDGFKVIAFIEAHCVLTDGEWVGQPFLLLDWQKQLLIDLFEINPETGLRRYRTALIGVAKKNGKTELAAAIGLYLLVADGEPAPHVVCAAAGDDQADLVFGAAKTMAEKSPTLSRHLDTAAREITVKGNTRARLRRVAASGGRLDGKNIFAGLCDELHEWVTPNQRKTWGMIRGGMAARRQPLNFNITTAGFDQESLCHQQYLHGRRVEIGEVEDAGLFFRWWEVPAGGEDFDYRDIERHLPAANPSLGVTVQIDFYRDELSKRTESEFRRYYYNQWVEAEDVWIPAGSWEACAEPGLEIQPGRPTYVAWDASTHHDSTALVAVQWRDRPEGGRDLIVEHRIWQRPNGPDGNPIANWTLPIAEVEADVRLLHEVLTVENLKGVAYDPAFITWSAQGLAAEGVPMLEWPQTDARMVGGTRLLYELITNGRLRHNGDPTATRQIRSAKAVMTRNTGIRLTKTARGAYIDFAIALAMALALAIAKGDGEPDIGLQIFV